MRKQALFTLISDLLILILILSLFLSKRYNYFRITYNSEGMNSMDQKAIGRRIKAARERKGLTQEELAEKVDLSPMHVSVIERGVKLPKLETLINIANVLDVSADVLLQDVVNNQTKLFASEASELILQLRREDQRRALAVLRSFVEASK